MIHVYEYVNWTWDTGNGLCIASLSVVSERITSILCNRYPTELRASYVLDTCSYSSEKRMYDVSVSSCSDANGFDRGNPKLRAHVDAPAWYIGGDGGEGESEAGVLRTWLCISQRDGYECNGNEAGEGLWLSSGYSDEHVSREWKARENVHNLNLQFFSDALYFSTLQIATRGRSGYFLAAWIEYLTRSRELSSLARLELEV